MSYSRWSNSRWYTFWRVPYTGTRETRASAIFEICGLMEFNAARLRKDIEGCLEEACRREGGVSTEEKDELRTYMQDFLADVDREYPKHQST